MNTAAGKATPGDSEPGNIEPTGVPQPPAGMTGEPGPLLKLISDQRIAFLLVGGFNTVIGAAFFILFQFLLGDRLYIPVLLCAHVCAVLCAFVLYRRFVFRVTGHVLRDLWRFELINLTALGVNLVLLTVAVSVFRFPVLLSQLTITAGTMLISFFGHRGFSFRRTSAELEAQRNPTEPPPDSPRGSGTA